MGVYGILGQDAEECAPESGLEFEDIVEISKEMTEKLKERKGRSDRLFISQWNQ